MLREGRPLPKNVLDKIPDIAKRLSKVQEVVALFAFGSAAKRELKPLSDLDFGILLSGDMDKKARFGKELEFIGIFNETFRTDEIDLVVMNDAPTRFSFNIIKEGKLLFCRDKDTLVDFVERTVKLYLDFRFFRDDFDRAFLKGVRYGG